MQRICRQCFPRRPRIDYRISILPLGSNVLFTPDKCVAWSAKHSNLQKIFFPGAFLMKAIPLQFCLSIFVLAENRDGRRFLGATCRPRVCSQMVLSPNFCNFNWRETSRIHIVARRTCLLHLHFDYGQRE